MRVASSTEISHELLKRVDGLTTSGINSSLFFVPIPDELSVLAHLQPSR